MSTKGLGRLSVCGQIQGDFIFSVIGSLLRTSDVLFVTVISFSDIYSIEFMQTQDTFRLQQEPHTVPSRVFLQGTASASIGDSMIASSVADLGSPSYYRKMITKISLLQSALTQSAFSSKPLEDSSLVPLHLPLCQIQHSLFTVDTE